MASKDKNQKKTRVEKINCAHCKKKLIVSFYKETITKSVAGEYKEIIKIEKDTQKTLK